HAVPPRSFDNDSFHDGMGAAPPNHNRRIAHPDHRTVFAHNPVFRLKTLAAHTRIFGRLDYGMILSRDVAYPIARIRQPFVLRVARDGFDLRTDVMPLAAHPEFRDITDRRHLFDQ